MRAVDMNRRITIEAEQEVDLGGGQWQVQWTQLGSYWAERRQQSGEEAVRAGAMVPDKVVFFRLRYVSGLTSRSRVLCDGETYEVTDVREIGRREGLELRTELRP